MEKESIPNSCKECQYLLHTLTSVGVCGHSAMPRTLKGDRKEVQKFIDLGIKPNYCPLIVKE